MHERVFATRTNRNPAFATQIDGAYKVFKRNGGTERKVRPHYCRYVLPRIVLCSRFLLLILRCMPTRSCLDGLCPTREPRFDLTRLRENRSNFITMTSFHYTRVPLKKYWSIGVAAGYPQEVGGGLTRNTSSIQTPTLSVLSTEIIEPPRRTSTTAPRQRRCVS